MKGFNLSAKATLLDEGYTVYCIADIMQCKYGNELMKWGCDNVWEMCIAMAEDFRGSNYDDYCKSEYDCLEDYCKDMGDDWLKRLAE